MTTDTTPATADRIETWLYAGQRCLSTGKLVNAWQTPDDPDHLALVDFKVKAGPTGRRCWP